jgi:hypothetical protein
MWIVNKFNSLSLKTKVIISLIVWIVFIAVVILVFFWKSNNWDNDLVYNSFSWWFEIKEMNWWTQKINKIPTLTQDDLDSIQKNVDTDEVTELESTHTTSIWNQEWETLNIDSQEELDSILKTDNLEEWIVNDEQQQILQQEKKENQQLLVAADDQSISKKEIQINSMTVEELKSSYETTMKQISSEFKKLWVSEQDQIISNINRNIWSNVEITKNDYIKKVRWILQYLYKEHEYTMLEKILNWWTNSIVNWSFITTLKSDRMLFNNALIEVL